jgi:modulator of drug activity B
MTELMRNSNNTDIDSTILYFPPSGDFPVAAFFSRPVGSCPKKTMIDSPLTACFETHKVHPELGRDPILQKGVAMANIFILNAHEAYPFAPGKLNQTLVEHFQHFFLQRGDSVRITRVTDTWLAQEEVDHHVWADLVILQTPVYWMGVPAACKRYMDHVYSAGLDGRLCTSDGRTRKNPDAQYGSGGTCQGKRYLLSLTFNAPREAFDDPAQTFFSGKTVDDLFWPMHLNFKFFGMTPLPTFSCHDVIKQPDVEADLRRLTEHLTNHVS